MAKKVNEVDYDALELPSNTNEVDYDALEIPQGTEKKNSYSQPTNQGTTASTSKPLIFKDALEKPSEESKASAYAPQSIESEQKPKFDPIEHTRIEIEKNNQSMQDLSSAYEQNVKTLTDLENQYNDPQIPTDTKDLLAEQYNKTLADTKTLEDGYNKTIDRQAKLEVRRKALLAPSELRKENDIDAFDGFINAIKRGTSEGEVVGVMSDREFVAERDGKAVIEDKPYTDEEIKKITEEKKYQATLGKSKAYKEWEKESPSSSEYWKKLASDPFEIIGQLSAESMATMVRHGITKAPQMAAKGAAIGTVVPGLGTLSMAGAGFTAGMGLTGFNMEVSASILESLTDAGIDVTNPESLKKGFENKDLMDEAKSHAYKRGVPIAIMDMVSLGIAGRLVGKQAGKSLAKKVAKGGIEMAEQTALDAAGEASAQLIADQKLDFKEIMGEVLGGQGMNIATIAVGSIVEAKKQGKKIFNTASKLNVPQEQFNEMVDVSAGMGDITIQQSDEIKQDYANIQKAKSSIPVEYQGSTQLIDDIASKQRLDEELEAINMEAVDKDISFASYYEAKRKPIQDKIDALNKSIQAQLKEPPSIELDQADKREAIDLDITPQVEPPVIEEITADSKVDESQPTVSIPPIEVKPLEVTKNEPTVEPITETEAIIDSEGVSGVSEVSEPMAEGIQPTTEGQVQEVPKVEPTPKDALSEAEQVSGDTALQIAEREDYVPSESNPNEWIEYIAAKSKNVFEIAKTYVEQLKNQLPTMSAKNQAMYDRGITFTEAEFREQTGFDAKDLTPYQRSFINNNPSQDLDQQLQGLDEKLTINDYFDFIDDLGRGTAVNKEGQKLIDGLVEAYRRETGQKLTPYRAKILLGSTAAKVAAGVEKSTEQQAEYEAEKSTAENQGMIADGIREVKSDNPSIQKAINDIADKVKTGVSLARAIQESIIQNKLRANETFNEKEFVTSIEDASGKYVTGVKKSETERLREKFNLGDAPDSKRMSDSERATEAQRILKDNPDYAKGLVDALLNNDNFQPSELQQEVLKYYIATLAERYSKNRSPELFNALRDAANAGIIAGQRASSSLAAMRGFIDLGEYLGGWELQLSEILGTDQIPKELYDEIKAYDDARQEAKKKIVDIRNDIESKLYAEDAQAEIDKLKAKIDALSKKKDKTYNAKKRKSQADYIRERFKKGNVKITLKDKDGNSVSIDDVTTQGFSADDKIVEIIAKAIEQYGKIEDAVTNAIAAVRETDFYQKLNKSQQEDIKGQITDIMNIDERADLIKDIKDDVLVNGVTKDNAKMVKKLLPKIIENGETKAQGVIDAVFKELDGVVSKNDINAIIAGVYNDKRTETQLRIQMNDLRTYAKLVEKLKALQEGKDKPKNERAKRQVSAEIKSLRDEIAEIEKRIKLETQLTPEQKAINAKQKAIDTIYEKIENFDLDFNKPVKAVSDELNALNEELKQAQKDLRAARENAGLIERPLTPEQKAEQAKAKTLFTLLDKLSNWDLSQAQKKEGVQTEKTRELSEQIKQAQKDLRAAREFVGAVGERYFDNRIKAAKKATKEIETKIANGDFSKTDRRNILADPKVRSKYPNKIKELETEMKRKRDAEHDFEVAKIRERIANRSLTQKAIDSTKKTINTGMKLQATYDNSAAMIHGLLILLSHPTIWAKGVKQGVFDALTKDIYHASIERMQDDPMWEYAKVGGLDVMDMDAMKDDEREAFTLKTWLDEEFKVKGKNVSLGNLGFNFFDRLFVATGNAMRFELFKQRAATLVEQGYDIGDKKGEAEYKSAARAVNNLTGRGGLSAKNLQTLNMLLWAPNLISSSINTLGISDLFYINNAGKTREEAAKLGVKQGYYKSLTEQGRKEALKDLTKVVLAGGSIMALAYMYGAKVEDDPEEPLFGKITFENGRIVDVFGQLSSLVRIFIRMSLAIKTQIQKASGNEEELPMALTYDDAMYKVLQQEKINKRKEADEVALRYFRGKLNPAAAIVVDLITGTDFMGEKVYSQNGLNKDWMMNKVTPITLKNMYEAANEDWLEVYDVPFYFTGAPYQDKRAWDKIMRTRISEKEAEAEYKKMVESLESGYLKKREEKLLKMARKEIKEAKKNQYK